MDIQCWLRDFTDKLMLAFGKKIVFLGLQGSYARGEYTNDSDIDIVVIFDSLDFKTLKTYKQFISSMPCSEKICGFVSGREELSAWDKADLFQFYYDTKPIIGSLDTLIERPGRAEAAKAVHVNACSLYHMCSHNYLHAEDKDVLKSLYKAAAFIIRAKYFAENGIYISRLKELSEKTGNEEKEILKAGERIKNEGTADFEADSCRLLTWLAALVKYFLYQSCTNCVG